MKSTIQTRIQDSIKVKEELLKDESLVEAIASAVEICISALKNSGQILFAGNGGSAADAQHIAAELSGRFYKDRKPYNAEALHVNTSYLTAVANDYGYDEVYRRMIQAKFSEKDVFIAISTSGNSSNILSAVKEARQIGGKVIGMTGLTGGALKDSVDVLLNIPSNDTPRIQEAHILIGHILCELIENEIG